MNKIRTIGARMPMVIAHAAQSRLADRARTKLQTVAISNAIIPGIGNSIRSILIAHDICTAADVNRQALSAIQGLGEARTTALLLWRSHIEARVLKDISLSQGASKEVSAADEMMIGQQVESRRNSIKSQLDDLGELVVRIRERAAVRDARLETVLNRRDQAAADLVYLGLVPRRTPSPSPSAAIASKLKAAQSVRKGKTGGKASKKAKKNTRTCPRCSAPMVKRWGSGVSSLFYGCSAYPVCNQTLPIRKKRISP